MFWLLLVNGCISERRLLLVCLLVSSLSVVIWSSSLVE